MDQTAAANHNAAAYVLTETRKVGYITPILRLLHCLIVCQRVSLKMLLLVYEALSGSRLKCVSYLLVHYKALRSSGTGLLSVTKDRKRKHRVAAVRFYAPQILNKLPLQPAGF